MPSEEVLKRLATLSDREREVLSLVCMAKPYRDIAAMLYIAEGTVKSHMAHIYIKLGLDQMTRSKRLKTLHEQYCLGSWDDLPPPPAISPPPAPPPPEVLKQVEEDEKALIVVKPQAMTMTPTPPQRGCVQRLISGGLITLFVAAGVLLGGYLLIRFALPEGTFASPQSPVSSESEPASSNTESEVEDDEPTPLPPTPTNIPASPLPEDTPRPTSRPAPTNTPRPTNTSVPPTPVYGGIGTGVINDDIEVILVKFEYKNVSEKS